MGMAQQQLGKCQNGGGIDRLQKSLCSATLPALEKGAEGYPCAGKPDRTNIHARPAMTACFLSSFSHYPDNPAYPYTIKPFDFHRNHNYI